MPGNGALSAQPATAPQQPRPGKVLHAIDAVSSACSPVCDLGELTTAALRAVAAGRGHVLGTSHVVFPNGAITLVLILAESHLSIHTWPEENLVAVDLFSCGAIDADRVISELAGLLRLDQVSVRAVPRGRPG
ncbi:MAG TPA: S-adenosylmethionine decarboxylase [Streptosporangiaceae bacterium]|nr:S-adenosylmethionine decarboxylase [Streptosporangiaceae bacterium]